MALSSSNTLLDTIEWSKKLTFGRRSALGNSLEPALTSASTVMQTILGPPFAWRWNRVVSGFITTAGQQDYTLINWQASFEVNLGWLTVDDAGNSQQVTTAGTSGSSAPSWNHTKGQTTTDGSVTWTNLGPIGVAVFQTYNLGWIETVSVQATVSGSAKWFEMENRICLASDSSSGRPRYIAAQTTDANGNITFRLTMVPDQAYPVAVTMQQPAVEFTSVNQTWTPIPDQYARIYNWGFLSMMLLFADDQRFGFANQKFVGSLLATSEGLTETQRNIFLSNWQENTGQPISNADRMQQGVQARGI